MTDEAPTNDELRLLYLDFRSTRRGKYNPKPVAPERAKNLPSVLLDLLDAAIHPCRMCGTGNLVYGNDTCGVCLHVTRLNANEAARFEAALDREPRVIPELATLPAGGRENG